MQVNLRSKGKMAGQQRIGMTGRVLIPAQTVAMLGSIAVSSHCLECSCLLHTSRRSRPVIGVGLKWLSIQSPEVWPCGR